MCLSHLSTEDTLERRKDMLYIVTIIRCIPPSATKIIKIYSKFPKTAFFNRKGINKFHHEGHEAFGVVSL